MAGRTGFLPDRLGDLRSVPLSDGSQRHAQQRQPACKCAFAAASATSTWTGAKRSSRSPRTRGRPFVVSAGGRQVVAVGTRFSVRRDGADLRVVVTEGNGATAGRSRAPGGPLPATLLPAGSVALVSQQRRAGAVGHGGGSRAAARLARGLPDLPRHLAGRGRGRVQPLRHAQDGDGRRQAVAALRVGGNFRWSNAEAFVRLLEQGFPVRAEPTRTGSCCTAADGAAELPTIHAPLHAPVRHGGGIFAARSSMLVRGANPCADGEEDAASVPSPAVEPGLFGRPGRPSASFGRGPHRYPRRRAGHRAGHPGPPVGRAIRLSRRPAAGPAHLGRARGEVRPGSGGPPAAGQPVHGPARCLGRHGHRPAPGAQAAPVRQVSHGRAVAGGRRAAHPRRRSRSWKPSRSPARAFRARRSRVPRRSP